MSKKILILVLGILFLILMIWAGTTLTEILPQRPTAQVQTAQAGPYKLTMQVDPNPPTITRPAQLTLQIVRGQQLVTNARITVESSMESMDMGIDSTNALPQSNGAYHASVQFLMGGPWQVRVIIAMPGAHTENAIFTITAQ